MNLETVPADALRVGDIIRDLGPLRWRVVEVERDPWWDWRGLGRYVVRAELVDDPERGRFVLARRSDGRWERETEAKVEPPAPEPEPLGQTAFF